MDDTKIEFLINNFRNKSIDNQIIKKIVDNYDKYPLYIIKYITVYYPTDISNITIHNIIYNDQSDELMDCIISSYCVKLCDITLMTDFVCKNECMCYSRICWKLLYVGFIDALTKEPTFFLSSNVYSSLVNLISKTDVQDEKIFHFIKTVAQNPQYWNKIIKFIGDTELFSSNYGDIIFAIRDLILTNDKMNKEKQNKQINNFRDRYLLGSLLRKYNEKQKNVTNIVDNIYLTDINGAKNISILKDKKIQYIITLTKKQIFHVDDIMYLQIPIDDIGSVNFVEMTIDTIDQVVDYLNQHKIILVHCYRGLSRSVCFVILLLIKLGWSFQNAYDLVSKKKEYIDPNPEFIKQIVEFEKKQIMNNTVTQQ
jgi:protein-tyrosine phosphatase